MENMMKGIRPSKLDACIENITRTLAQRNQENSPHHSTHQTDFYRTEACQNTNEHDSPLKIKIRKVGSYQTPEELKPYECPICHKKISNQANLRTHIRTHTGDKPHRCGICGKSFSRNGTLQTHLTIHSGVKLFKCEICGREIRDRGNLSKHMKIHLSNIVPKKETRLVHESQIYIPKTDIDLSHSQKTLSRRALDSMNPSQLDIIKKEIYALNNSQTENLKRNNEIQNDTELDLSKLKNQKINPLSDKGSNSSTKDDSDSESETLKQFQDQDIKQIGELPYKRIKHPQDSGISYNCGLCLIAFPNTDSYFSHMMAHARDQRYSQSGPDYINDQLTGWTKNKRQTMEEIKQNDEIPGEQEMFAAYEREMRAWDQRFSQRGHEFMDEQEIDLSKYRQIMKMEDKRQRVDPTEQEMLDAYEKEIKAYRELKIKAAEKLEGSFSNEQKMVSAADQNSAKSIKQSMTEADEQDEEKMTEKSNFKCGICGDEYKTKDSFEDHITIHRVDKPYQCTICLEQFKELRFLQKHIKSHRGLNTLWCEICGKEFSQNNLLIEHLQTHAEDQPCGSNLNGGLHATSTKIPHPQQPQGDKQEMFIVIE